MYRLIHYLRGYVRIRITGAAPEEVLNAYAREGVAFWEIRQEDPLHCLCCVWLRDRGRAEALAARRLCTVETVEERGLICLWRSLRRRPVLLLAMAAAIAACFLSQKVVLFITVEGERSLHEEEVLRALEEIGIRPGSAAGDIDQQLTKHRMLYLVPELSWLGANRTGFCLRAEVTERSTAEFETQPYAAANVVALRSGVLTEVTVFQGMRLCREGDTVREGQVLVSAFEDHGLFLRAVCANAEIYAQTWYSGTVVTPSVTAQKRYTGEEFREVWLIVGRKRIKICGNGSISLTECDKMVEVKELTLPKGYTLPVALEISTYRPYETVPVPVSPMAAEEQLLATWLQQCRQGMIAGSVQETISRVLEAGGVYVLHAESTCNEMIARVVPVEAAYEGEDP